MDIYLRSLVVGKTLGILASLLVLGTLLAALTLRAQQVPSPNPDFVDALWVAKSDRILKIAAADGASLLEITDVQNVRAVAVDEQRGVLWAFGHNTLRAYGFNGTPSLSIPVSPATEKDEGDVAALSVNPNNGTVWLGVSKSLRHFTPQGQVLTTIPLTNDVRALALDKTTSRLWVATQKSVSAYNDAGMVVQVINLGRNPDVKDLDLRDAGSGELWVALKDTLRRYAATGTLTLTKSLKGVAHITSDGQGVWAATATSLLRLNEAGTVLVQLPPFADAIVALVADPIDASVWVATTTVLRHIGAEGQALQTLQFQGPPIRDLALYVDTIPPVLSFTAPANGAVIDTATPQIGVSYSDIGSGVDTASLFMQANGTDLAVNCTFTAVSATCTPTTPLLEGSITLTAAIEDFAGNVSEPATVSFTVELNEPPMANAGPDQAVTVGATVQLNGGASSDPDADPLTYRWTLSGQPEGSTATLSGATTVTPSFVPDVAGSYSVQLIVNDGQADSAPDTVQVTATAANRAPAAKAGPDQNVTVGATVTLDGSGSNDPDGNPLTYQWTLTGKPAGSTATLTNATTARPSFVADQAGAYEAQLIVNDGTVDSAPDTVTITAHAGGVTALTGQILDTNAFVMGGVEVPVVGARVSLLGADVSTTSNVDGYFTLSWIPAGEQVLDIDTSTAQAAPDDSPYAGFREAIELTAGVINVVERPFFLPRIARESLVTVDPNVTTVVTNATLGVSMTVPPHTAKNPDGTDFTGQLSISLVPDALAPASLPEELQPGLLITIQPVGVIFTPPVPITFPNTDTLVPGSEADIWSLDPEMGTFIVVGTGQVSADGSRIETIAGGIRAADWHATLPPKPGAEDSNDDDCKPCEVSTGSEVSVASGNLKVEHELASYLSLNQLNIQSLVYNSLRADPQPVISSKTTILRRAAVPRTVSASLKVAGVDQGVAVFTDTSGLSESQDETIRQVVQFQASGFATGTYPYRLKLTSNYPRSSIASTLSGTAMVNNQQQSPFGAGWTLAELQHLHLQPDGNALIAAGDGTAQLFTVGPPGSTIVESGWSLADTVSLAGAQSAHYNPVDGLLYVGRRDTGATDGLYRINANGSVTKLANGSNVAAIVVDPDDGDLFFAEDFGGNIFRTAFGGTGRSTWVSGLHAGDDDPIGMAIAPADYTGGLISPGQALVVDRGFNGPDEIWRFSPDAAEGEVLVRADDGTLINPVDVTIGRNAIYLVDTGEENGGSTPGRIYRLGTGGALTQVMTSQPLLDPIGITIDPLTGDLFVLDAGGDRLVRVNPATGTVSDMFTGVAIQGGDWAGVDVTPDGAQLFLTGMDAIYTFTRGDAFQSPPGEFSTLGKNADGTFTRTLKDGTKIHFNAQGLQTAVVDRTGNTTTYTYDAAGRLLTITDPVGLVTTLTYSNGLLASIRDPAGRTTVFTHDANGNLTRITDPDSSSRQFAYDARHRLTAQTDKRGFAATYAYDFAGRYMRSTLSDGSTRQASPSQMAGLIDPSSGLGTETNPAPVVRPQDVIATFTDGEGHITTFETGRFGEATQITDSAGLTTQIDRDADGNPTRLVLPSQHTLSQTYDAKGNLLTTTDETVGGTTSVTYEPTFNQVTSITDALSETTAINYDASGNPIQITSPLGRAATFDYGSHGLLASLTDLLGTEATFTYDAKGDLVQVAQGSGADQRIVTIARTPEGYIDSITDPLDRVFNFTYDLLGRVTSQTLPDGRGIDFTYDANGNLTSVTPPGRPAHAFAYTPMNLLAEYTPPDVGAGNTKTVYTYNAAQQLTRITRPDGVPVNFAYDNAGRFSSLTLPRGQVSVTYNATTGKLATVASPDGVTLSYGYDGELFTDEGWTGEVAGTVSRTYDSEYRVVSRSVNDGDTISFSYDADGLLTRAGSMLLTRAPNSGLVMGTSLSDVTDTRSYNSFGEWSSYTAAFNGSPLYTVQHVRDKLGRITQKTETTDGVTSIFNYTYDLEGRLIEVKANGVTVSTYTYDSNGNRLTGPGGTTTYTYDAQDRLLTLNSGLGTQNYAYTANGELFTKTIGSQTTTYQYDELGNLLRVVLPSGTQIEYVIDGRNRRIGKRVNGVLVQGFLYVGKLRPVTQLDGSNNVVSRFIYAGEINVPAYMIKGGVTYRIITDHLGSPRLVVDVITGQIVQRMDYDEFGNVLTDTNPGFQPFGFAGGLYDRDTGLIRFGARDYDPETGRWMAKDPILFASKNTNLYNYVGNDPVNSHDPTGKIDWEGWKLGVKEGLTRIKASWREILILINLAIAGEEPPKPPDPPPPSPPPLLGPRPESEPSCEPDKPESSEFKPFPLPFRLPDDFIKTPWYDRVPWGKVGVVVVVVGSGAAIAVGVATLQPGLIGVGATLGTRALGY